MSDDKKTLVRTCDRCPNITEIFFSTCESCHRLEMKKLDREWQRRTGHYMQGRQPK